MSVLVTTQLKTRSEHTDRVVAALSEALPSSIKYFNDIVSLTREQ